MASAITPPNVTTDLAGDAALAVAFMPHECAHCRLQMFPGERWVREKIYEPLIHEHPRYLRYHADLFPGEQLSCWEKHQLERDTARAGRRAA